MWSSALLAAAAFAGPLPVHGAVFAEPSDGDEGQRIAESVADLLRHSGSYQVLDAFHLEGRLGEAPGRRFTTCNEDVRCWRRTGEQVGVEQVVLVERVDASHLGIRVLDITGTEGFRRDMAEVGPWGAPDRGLLQQLFFQPGTLRLEGAPEGAVLELDSRVTYELPGGEVEIAPLSAGKHALEITAPGYLPFFSTVMVNPGQTRTVQAELVPPLVQRPDRRPWGWVVALGLLAAGGTGVGVAAASAMGTVSAP